jgi:HSP20 family protein
MDMKATLQKEHRVPTDGTQRRVEFVTPAVNIFETKDGYVVEAEMPGVTKDGLEVTLEGNEITILGHRTPDPTAGQVVFSECANADFRRGFEMDPAIDSARISAKMNQGVLTLTLPKSERVKPRKISVE